MIDEADALRFFGGNHFSGEAEFMRDAFAAQARQALRAAVTGNDAELHFRLAELGGFAGQANGAGKRELAAAAQGEAVDGADGRLAERFEEMKNALAEQRKILAVDWGAQGKFADVRAGNK